MERTNQMITFLIIYFSLGVISSIFAYGSWIGYLWNEFPILRSKHRFKELKIGASISAFISFFCPPVSIANYFCFERNKYGLLFCEPKQKL